MAKILIDTNVFLHFYNASHETLDVFDQIFKNVDHLLLSEQIISEFRRNRIFRLKELSKGFRNSKREGLNLKTALTESLTDYSKLKNEIQNFNDTFEKLSGKIALDLNKMIEKIELDPIASKVEKLYKTKNLEIISIKDKDFEKAKRRKMLGNPPMSDKDTICDEIIWEGILSQVNDDLVFVTRDKRGFDSYKNILCHEFKEVTGKTLQLVDRCSEAIKLVGGKVPPEVAKAEEKDISNWNSTIENLRNLGISAGPVSAATGLSALHFNNVNIPMPTDFPASGFVNPFLTMNTNLSSWAPLNLCASCYQTVPYMAEKCPNCGKNQK